MALEQSPDELDTRVETLAQQCDLRWVTAILTHQRSVILARWLRAAEEQPFHAGRQQPAVADHIPSLYDALLAFLDGVAPSQISPWAPFEDPSVVEAARRHARARLEQGLEPPDIVVEFRLLRQEILAAMRKGLPDAAPTGDVLAATLLVNDALDGAISVGIGALTQLVESAREDFLATTMHDVRQPLTVIKGNAQLAAQLLRRSHADPGQVAELLDQVTAQSDWMVVLLNALLDASRVALHQLELTLEPADLEAVLREAIGGLGPQAGERVSLTMQADFDSNGLWDRTRLAQVAKNLLSNALKYSPPGSPVTVTVAGTGDAVEFSVRDQGMGMSGAELRQLFQRYSRAQGAVRGGVEGLGLGLYLCKGIVQAHGGAIWATSDGPGLGSTFTVSLPRGAPHPPAH